MCRKFLLLLLFVSILTLTPSRKLRKDEKKCVQENGVDRNYIKKHGHELMALLQNSTTMCYVACVLREQKTIKKNGHLNIMRVERNLHNVSNREKIINAYKRCNRKKGENFCETTVKISKCILKNKIVRAALYPKNTGRITTEVIQR